MNRRITAIILGVLVIGGLFFWGYNQYRTSGRMETALANSYNRAFFNTLDHVNKMEVLFAKSLVSGDKDQYDKLFTEIWHTSEAGMDNITQLPVADNTMARTVKFLTQAGDYAKKLADNTQDGKALTEKELKNLQNLYRQVGDLNGELQNLEQGLINGKIDFRKMARKAGKAMNEEGKQLAGGNFQDIDEKMQTYPTLIYDGPFSDHLEKRTPAAIGENSKKISRDKAKEIAGKFIDKKGGKEFVTQVTGKVEGKIPAYRVELTPRKDGKVSGSPAVMDITEKGGKVVWSTLPRDIPEKKIEIKNAREKAREFLNSRGYKNMKAAYFQENDNSVTFNFVSQEGKAIVYPDMIKTTVALDNGEVVAVDARQYLMSHKKRDLSEPKITKEEAKALLRDNLKITRDGRLAVIPTETFEEKLTWEFECKTGENTFLVYINALTGEEERILQLFKTDQGTLTM